MFIDLCNDSLYSNSVAGTWLHFETTFGSLEQTTFFDLFTIG